jgi:hypothetical protein
MDDGQWGASVFGFVSEYFNSKNDALEWVIRKLEDRIFELEHGRNFYGQD